MLEGREPTTADIDALARRVVDYMVPIFKREQLTDMAYDILEERRQERIAEKRASLEDRLPAGTDDAAVNTQPLSLDGGQVVTANRGDPADRQDHESQSGISHDVRPVLDWLVSTGSDGRLQAERPPPEVWESLNPNERSAVDHLLARNAEENSRDASVQRVSSPPDGANETGRNEICTAASYICLSKGPGKVPAAQWHASCMNAEATCNAIVNQNPTLPPGADIIVPFPDRGFVVIPGGGRGPVYFPHRGP